MFGLQVVQHTVPHPRDAAERGGLDLAKHLCQEALDGTGWGAGGPPRTQGSSFSVGARIGSRTAQVTGSIRPQRPLSRMRERRKEGQKLGGQRLHQLLLVRHMLIPASAVPETAKDP